MPYDLERFITAQEPVINKVITELKSGQKRSHWMWFIFPQIAGLGHSAMSQHYAIADLNEAAAYLAHPVLGRRLEHCTALVLATQARSAHETFGSPDDLKFHSCMTLFAQVAEDDSPFDKALGRFFAGFADSATRAKLNSTPSGTG